MNRTHCLSIGTAVLAIAIIIGCDHDKPNTKPSAGIFSDSDDTISSLRLDPDLNTLRVRPDIVTVESISDSFVFEVDGGQDPFTWSVANAGNGSVTVLADSTARYNVTRVAKNAVVVFDSTGHWGASEVFAVNGLTLIPADGTIEVSGGTIQFSVVGGEPPYTFSLGVPGIGTITSGGLYTRTDEGEQFVTVIDANEGTDSSKITQPAEQLSITTIPASGTLGTNDTLMTLNVDGSVGPYFWFIVVGSTPGGTTLSPASGSSTVFDRVAPLADGFTIISVTNLIGLSASQGIVMDQSD